MVVIQGPRFSTRAESRWFASQGFTLVNMTGYPEAVLARELEMCYAAIALVTDLDAGIDAGSAVRAVDVFAEFERNLVPFKKLVHEAIDRRGSGRPHVRIACRTRASSCPSTCRESSADRCGGLHRSPGRTPRCATADHDVVAVDAMLAAAHGPDAELPPG